MQPTPFSGPTVSSYADSARRQVPGLVDLHRMTTMLLAERMPANGRVLVLGGFYQGALADAEIYSPHNNTWTTAPPMALPRCDHTAVLLGDGSVLIYGGNYQGVLDSPEIYSLPHHGED